MEYHQKHQPFSIYRFSSLLLIIAFIWMGISPVYPQHSKPSPAQRLMRLIAENQSVRFQLIHERDPYQIPAQRNQIAKKSASLHLNRDHTFTEKSLGIQQIGRWKLNPKESSLTILYASESEQTRGQAAPAHTQQFEIKSFSNSRLVLAWQGRHGMVVRTYAVDRQ